jgi:hypothetical protein
MSSRIHLPGDGVSQACRFLLPLFMSRCLSRMTPIAGAKACRLNRLIYPVENYVVCSESGR